MFGMLSCLNLGGHNQPSVPPLTQIQIQQIQQIQIQQVQKQQLHPKNKYNKHKNTMDSCLEAGDPYQLGINPSVAPVGDTTDITSCSSR